MQYIVLHFDTLTGRYTPVGPFETAAQASGWAYGNLSENQLLAIRILPLKPPERP